MTNIIIYHTQVKKHRIPHKSWKRIFALLRTAVQWVEASVLLDESWAQTPSKLLTHQTQDTTQHTRIVVLTCFDFERIFLNDILPRDAFDLNKKMVLCKNDELSPRLFSENPLHLLLKLPWHSVRYTVQ